MITASIFLVFYMHIGPTKLLKNGVSNIQFDVNKRFCPKFTNLNWDNSAKIEETITADKNSKDEEEDFRKKNKRL